jgi:hypothetical protein
MRLQGARPGEDAAAEILIRGSDLSGFARSIGVDPDSFDRAGTSPPWVGRPRPRDVWAVGEQEGVTTARIEGAARTSGASPGRTPAAITVRVGE